MNLLDPVKWGAQAAFSVTTTALRVGQTAVRTAELLLGRDNGDDAEHRATPDRGATTAERDRETPGSATRGHRAADPTSAAGASRGVAGTVDAPGAAAAVDAPDPTAPAIPHGERRPTAPAPPAPEERFKRDDEIEADEVVESEGSASPGATLRVDAPWDGYDAMKAGEIAQRIRGGDPATKAVVRLYEQTHKKRKSVLAATE